MIFHEIGSEFHKMEFGNGLGLSLPFEGTLVFSGRTALETVLKELPACKTAVLPSYCCDSMIEPFRKAGIKVEFYPVRYENGLKIDLEIPNNTDIFLWCNYFGYRTLMPDMSDFKKHGGIIIEDITHSLLSTPSYSPQSNYLIASIRKWEAITCGGYCASVNGNLIHNPVKTPPSEFIEKKFSAMQMKTEYLNEQNELKKQQFLSMFGDSNHWLCENYSELTIDPFSKEFLWHVNVDEQKQIRCNNAHVLYEGLKNTVEFVFKEEDMDCPLFVPVILSERDKVRKFLSDNKIYCPIHWPKPKGCLSNLYDMELSIICDQRYGEKDMQKIISILAG